MLRAHLGPKRLAELAPLDLERFKREVTAAARRGSGQTQCNRALELLRTVLRAARTWGLTSRADNPVADVKRFKESKGRDRILSGAEEARLLAALPEPHRTAVRVALECGARLQAELLALEWRDVNLDTARLTIPARIAKSGRERGLPLTDTMVATLRALREAAEQRLGADAVPTARVFTAKRGGPLSHFKHRFYAGVRAAGLAGTGLGVHSLRHTWASRMVESGCDLVMLQRLGGWSSLELVGRYSHARDERGAEAIRTMLAAREREARPALHVVPPGAP